MASVNRSFCVALSHFYFCVFGVVRFFILMKPFCRYFVRFCKVQKQYLLPSFTIDFYNETFPLYTVHTVLCTVSNLSDAFCPRGHCH